MITVKEAARRLGLHKSTVLNRIHAGILKAHKIERVHFFYEVDEQSLIENLTLKLQGRRRNLKKYAKKLRGNYSKSMAR